MKLFNITIPGSIANIGPGFDVIAGAINLYLNIIVKKSDKFEIIYCNETNINCDFETNLITKTAYLIAKTYSKTFPKDVQLEIYNTIPIGKGFGSSAAAIVGGIYLANLICNLNLNCFNIFQIATIIEGHPDNVAASIFGGIQSCVVIDENLEKLHNDYINLIKDNTIYDINDTLLKQIFIDQKIVIQNSIPFSSSIKIIAFIPKIKLDTSFSRTVLPKTYNLTDVIFNLQRVSVLISQFNNPIPHIFYECLKDRLHQPYRSRLIPNLEKHCLLHPDNYPGLLGSCLSGAGPSIITFVIYDEQTLADKIYNQLYKDNELNYLLIKFDNLGVKLI